MPKKDKDYYAVLHLDPSADAKMVEHAYWHLARALQAAAHTDPSAYERLEKLNEAYSVLGTPDLRAEYDQARRSTPPEPAPKEPKEPSEAQRPAPTVPAEKPRTATRVSLRTVAVPSWQSAITAGSLFAVAIVALLAGASPTLVLPLLAAGMALALVPTLRRLPSVPASARSRLSAPLRRWRAPRADFPRPSDGHTGPTAPRVARPTHRRQPAIDPADLRASTAATIARWRKGAEAAPPLRPGASPEEATPSGGAPDDPPSQP